MSTVAGPESETRDVVAFAGRSPVTVRRGAGAPFGWWPAICVALVAAIDRIEHSLLAGALPKIQAEFGFGDAAAGAIATAGAVAAVILLLPAGKLADTGRRPWIIAAVVAAWAILTLGTGLASSYAVLFGVRLLLGAGAQLYNPPASSLLGDFYPGPGRARAFGLERMAYFAGLPIGVIAGGALAESVGWRTGFFLVAVPGAIIAVLVLTIKDPVRGTGDRLTQWYKGSVAPSSTPPATPASPALPMRTQLVALMRIRTLRSVMVGLSIVFFGLGGLFFWIPSYYNRFFGLDEAASAAIGGSAGLVGIVAGIGISSWLGDKWHGKRAGWRVALGGWSLVFGTVGLTGAVAFTSLGPQAACMVLANLGFAGAIANLTAANADVIAASRRGLGFAALQFVTTLGGALGPWLIGVASDLTGSLRAAFGIVIVPLVIGSVVVLAGRRTYEADAATALAATTHAPPD